MEEKVLSWNDLIEMQRRLDAAIIEEKKLDLSATYWKRVVALITEMGEVANEQRFFKFWSNKGPSERSVCLEEFVDVLHFVLSILYISGNGNQHEWVYEEVKGEVVEAWLGLIACTFDEMSAYNAGRLVSHYLRLADLWGFSWEEIVQAYIDKNKVNFERLANGY